ncbi:MULTISPECIES: hypothetical protein [unclassified Crossiella]|uniref:hypothetical protein n=1 Tax=unclassified Crossiella TaxID=2620835 RepID=UPI001FFFCE3B|nr:MULTISPECIES: hypothetical protein [unclassified Crossiella]MCK2244426.1 hypothetical protein [Crossiella sp. S99.2]MCK2257746.1 hypothetical protein [Crossiella sp. S99.1]
MWDVLPLLLTDPRVAVTFAVDNGSVFSHRIRDHLAEAGARTVDWDTALTRRYDLALAASDNGELHRVRAPLILLPHGIGYHRRSPSDPTAISGLRRSALVRRNRIIPHTLVVAHDHQLAVIASVEPRLLPRALVAGDPCLDRIRVSEPRRREYRTAFGADRRELVLLCSTWGRHSLFGACTELPARILAALPTDRFRCALVLHPNVWAQHGVLKINALLRRATDAGLAVVPPEQGWQAAIVAASLVISDHGSLSSYSVGAGRPLLLATDGGPEVVPGSPLDHLRQRLPRLRLDEPLEPQIEQALGQDPGSAAAIFARTGQAAAILRARMYAVLGLPEPAWKALPEPLPTPEITMAEPDALRVRVSGTTTLTMRRYPVVPGESEPPGHLAVSEHAADPEQLERAAVVWSAARHDCLADADEWGAVTLRRWPGAQVAVTEVAPGSIVALFRDGHRLTGQATVPRSLAGSALYHWIPLGRPGTELTIQAGANSGVLRW